jgi:hypothetical protein
MLSDKKAIEAAVAELKSKGLKCDLLENAIPRAYYANQTGMGSADMVLKLHDSKYDVGLYKTDEGYESRCDFWSGDIEKQLGVTAGKDDDRNQAKLGKLFNAYAVHAASRAAVQKGYQVTRRDNTDGSTQLTITT